MIWMFFFMVIQIQNLYSESLSSLMNHRKDKYTCLLFFDNMPLLIRSETPSKVIGPNTTKKGTSSYRNK